MRKPILMIIISILVIGSFITWWVYSEGSFRSLGFVITFTVLIMVLALFYESIKNIRNVKSGLPVEDEHTKKAQYKAGYISYLISVYIWIALYFTKDLFPGITHILATGILSMASVFLITRFILLKRADV